MKSIPNEFDFSNLLSIAACDERLRVLDSKVWSHYEHGVGRARREKIALRKHRKQIALALKPIQRPLHFDCNDSEYIKNRAYLILNDEPQENQASSSRRDLRQESNAGGGPPIHYINGHPYPDEGKGIPVALEKGGANHGHQGQEDGLFSIGTTDGQISDSASVKRLPSPALVFLEKWYVNFIKAITFSK